MTSATPTLLETVLRRDRLVVIAGLIVVVAMAWAWLVAGADMDGWLMRPAIWTPAYALLMAAMWWVMMVAMMLPGAASTLLLFARMNRQRRPDGPPLVPASVFAAGYLAAWGGFSVVATGLQWALESARLLSPMLQTTNHWLGAGILVAAGLWQLTPLKAVCLRHCRSPLGFLIGRWRPGRAGAFRMGLEHGAYCLGCCWFLMGLLFVGGIMNLWWIAGLAAFVLLEKTLPLGHWLGRLVGVALLAWGVFLVAA